MKLICTFLAVTLSLMIQAQEVKVISFNIRYYNQTDGNDIWDLRKNAAGDFIAYEQPDFFGLQEAVRRQIQDFERSARGYSWVGVGRDADQGGEYTPIFYFEKEWELLESDTFWFSETPGKSSKAWDAAYPRICTWARFKSKTSGVEFLVMNTHFDHVGEVARLNSSKMILEKIDELKPNGKVILMGDFNAEPESDPIINLTRELRDSFIDANISYGQGGTFNGFNMTEIPARRIDYVFVGEAFDILKYAVDSRVIDGRYLSDHFPVLVELELTNQ